MFAGRKHNLNKLFILSLSKKMYQGLQSSLRENNIKSVLLLIAFPVILWAVVVVVLTFTVASENSIPYSEGLIYWNALAAEIFLWLWPVIIFWAILSFRFHRQIIFSFTWAKPITRTDYPEIYNIVENLCISRGLFVPRIGILEDDSLNAFATGRNSKNARIVFSRGLINKLEKAEIEAVAAHELTHIINRDSFLMVVIVVFVGVIGTLGQILVRTRGSSKSKNWAPLAMIWIALLIIGYLIYPLIQLALSRRREYLADAGSVLLTKDKYAMISALRKISQDSRIESIDKPQVALLCIAQPLSSKHKLSWFSDLFSTHPAIERRIAALESY